MGESMDSNHVPFKFPTRPYSLSQEWRNLTFIHWKVDRKLLKNTFPKNWRLTNTMVVTMLDLFFVMKMCGLKKHSLFRESQLLENSMFDICQKTAWGIFFDVRSEELITCMFAPRTYGLPYRYANSKLKHVEIHYLDFKAKKNS